MADIIMDKRKDEHLYNCKTDRYEIKSRGGIVLAWINAGCTDKELGYWLKNTVFTFNPNLC